MRRGIWLGALIAVVLATAIPLWLVLGDDGGGSRRAAALVTETKCSEAKDQEACEEFLRQLRTVYGQYELLQAELRTTQSEVQALEEQLNSIGDDAQLANVDLQNMLQKQQIGRAHV